MKSELKPCQKCGCGNISLKYGVFEYEYLPELLYVHIECRFCGAEIILEGFLHEHTEEKIKEKAINRWNRQQKAN